VTFTKGIALHDRISVDGEDVSNAFRSFGQPSERATVDVSGFSVSGRDETLAGAITQTFEGECFYTPEIYSLLKPLFDNETIFEVQWQPDGLVDPSREVYYGNCQLFTFGPSVTRGDVEVFPCTFRAADENGIQSAAAT
jgi:hypothetical protein